MSQVPPRSKFLFVNSFNQPSSKKSQELQSAAARAHAASRSFPKALRKPNVLFRDAQTQSEPKKERRKHRPLEKAPQTPVDLKPKDSDGWFETDMRSTGRRRSGNVTVLPDSSPQTLLDAGKWEPFDSFAVIDPSKDAQKLLDYAAIITWPIFGKSQDGQNVFVKRWMWTIMESPVAFYAQILSAAIHLQGNSRNNEIQRWSAVTSLTYRFKAIEALKEDVQRASVAPNAAIPDGVIAAVLNLAVHDCMNNSVLEEAHPPSPLSTYRNMHIYGRMEIREEHMKALYALVNRRGGLQAIDGATFAAVIPPADMLFSARKGVPPGFPSRRQREVLRHGSRWMPDDAAVKLLNQLGRALFPTLPSKLAAIPRLDSELIDLVEVAAELTTALDHNQRAENDPPSMELLINNRDWLVHRSLSLLPYYELEDALSPNSPTSSTSPPYQLLQEIYRLSHLIYLDMVLYPTPPHTRIKPRLAHTLVPFLLSIADQAWSGSLSHFLVWSAVLGGIAARFIPDRSLYVELLASRTERTESWESVRDRLQTYLWWDYVCDEPGRKIWDDVVNSMRS